MFVKWLVIFWGAFLLSYTSNAQEVFKTLGPQKELDISHTYFTHILQRALEVTREDASKPVSLQMLPHPGQERAMKLLESGEYYDVLWTANSIERNQKLIYVPFPLFKGLLGTRGLTVLQTTVPKLEKIDSVKALKKLSICQGLGWPDAAILKNAGFSVLEIPHFEAMLKMVEFGRCDAVALSVLEGAAEVRALGHREKALTFYTDILITYQLVMNFYLPPDRQLLKARLLIGLQRLDESGEFDDIMQTHPLTSEAMKQLGQGTRLTYTLPIKAEHLIEQTPYFIELK